MKRRTIINSGLRCYVKARAVLMRQWLEDETTHQRIMDLIEATALSRGRTRDLILPGLGDSMSGISVSLQILDDELLEAAFEEMVGGNSLEELRSRLSETEQVALEPVISMDHREVAVDCTGFLVYAILKNSRCLQELRAYLEVGKDDCYEAYLASSYTDTPFLQWFPVQLQTEARLCLGLLQRIRHNDEEAYHVYMRIAFQGYKRMRNELKRCGCVDGSVLRTLSEEEDIGCRLSILVLGLVMAQDMGIPMEEDYMFYTILSMLRCYEEKMFRPMEEVEITERGRHRQEEFERYYNCNDFHRCYVESVGRSPDGTKLEALHLEYEEDYDRVFSTFRMNPRVLHGIRLSREEIQRLCSTEKEWTWKEYEPVLLMGTLCKYITRISKTEQEEEVLKLRERLRDLQREVHNSRRLIQGMREQTAKAAAESEKSVRELRECREAVRKKKEQIAAIGKQRAADRRELEELRRYVYAGAEKAKEFTVDPIVSPHQRESGKDSEQSLKQILSEREIVVVGGHENWQRRIREQFPGWQYLSAEKNNFDVRMIQNKSIIIINTLVLKHSCYYRLMAMRRPEQRVLYVNENNLERFLEELGRQLL